MSSNGDFFIPQSTPGERVLSVTELVRDLNFLLEEAFPLVVFKGELQQVTLAPSGHLYITLKDETAQLPAVMWRSAVRNLKFRPEVGVVVRCVGRPTIYDRSGKLQMVLTSMSPEGEGALQRRFLELQEKLRLEGLFAPERKRRIPFFPRKIGIVSSSAGAAIHDIMVRIQDRMPVVQVQLIDVRVQGEGSAGEIARAIRTFNQLAQVEVIIVGRGGGSLEDLWSFNEEEVVRAIFASSIPIISAVGHEVDVTLSDLVADLRAPTPTAAGEMVVPRREDLLTTLADFTRRLSDVERWLTPKAQAVDEGERNLVRAISHKLEQARAAMKNGESRLATIRPQMLLTMLKVRVNSHAAALAAANKKQIALRRGRLDGVSSRLSPRLVQSNIDSKRDRLGECQRRLDRAIREGLMRHSNRLAALDRHLLSLSPRAVLQRGFAIVEQDGTVVQRASAIHRDHPLAVEFFDGRIEVTGSIE